MPEKFRFDIGKQVLEEIEKDIWRVAFYEEYRQAM